GLPMVLMLIAMIQFNVDTGNPPAVTTGVRIYAVALTFSVAVMARVNINQKLLIDKSKMGRSKL
ncbi:hypothetical protein LCGC14_2142410, partial [marine sediment metagenome]